MNILNMVYTLLFFSLQNAVCFIIITYLVPVLFTFYIQDVLKLKKNNSDAKRLIGCEQSRNHHTLPQHATENTDCHRAPAIQFNNTESSYDIFKMFLDIFVCNRIEYHFILPPLLLFLTVSKVLTVFSIFLVVLHNIPEDGL